MFSLHKCAAFVLLVLSSSALGAPSAATPSTICGGLSTLQSQIDTFLQPLVDPACQCVIGGNVAAVSLGLKETVDDLLQDLTIRPGGISVGGSEEAVAALLSETLITVCTSLSGLQGATAQLGGITDGLLIDVDASLAQLISGIVTAVAATNSPAPPPIPSGGDGSCGCEAGSSLVNILGGLLSVNGVADLLHGLNLSLTSDACGL